ncbi:MAG: tol-pal system protein YbgF [Caulobacteraceae bacterium]|nr:tol-pal system protein YbgF [Caulobacteraceae bacterium]
MRKSRFLRPALGAAAALLLASAAASALAQDQGYVEPANKRLDRLEKQLREVRDIVLQAHATGAPVEIKEAGPDPQVIALTSRLDDMDQSIRGITGQIEVMQHDLALARKDAETAQAQSAALSDRLDKLEKQVAALAPPPPAAPGAGAPGPGDDGGLAGQAAGQGQGAGQGPGPGAPGDPKAVYARARQFLLDGDYPSASAAFQDYVDRFGDTPNAVSARYWIGETKYIQEDYAGAAKAYLAAIHGWPQTAWAPDAVVKLSLSLVQLKQPKQACGALAELDRHYPHATPAAKARAAAARQKAGCAQ